MQPLDPSLPPAEACWSAGAALTNRDNHFQRQQQALLLQQQRMMGLQPAGMAPYQGSQQVALQHAPAAMPMLHQQPQQQLVFAPGATPQYTQQQMLMLQQQQQQGPSTSAAGYTGLPMSSTGPAGMSAGGFPVMQMQAQQLRTSTPQLQMQNSAPGSSTQPTYVWLQVPETPTSSGAYMAAHGMGAAQHQQLQAGMPAQGGYVHSPQASAGVAAGFMQQAGMLGSTGPAGMAMGLPGLPQLQQQFALSSEGMALQENTLPVMGFQNLGLQ
jgi:hypothetical protein